MTPGIQFPCPFCSSPKSNRRLKPGEQPKIDHTRPQVQAFVVNGEGTVAHEQPACSTFIKLDGAEFLAQARLLLEKECMEVN